MASRLSKDKAQKILIQPDISPSASTIIHFLSAHNISAREENGMVWIDQVSAEQLITLLYQELALSIEEKNSLRLLVLEQQEQFGFEYLQRFRSLNRWYQVFNAQDLLYIIESKSVLVEFQPIISLCTHQVYGYECLMRGLGQNGEVISPAKVFSQAKEMDLIFNLDRVVREQIIRAAHANQVPGYIFINFLPNSIYDPETCLKTTMRVVEELGLNPEKLVFEVVESERFENTNLLKDILQYYHTKGVRTALDDVGSGYSSLNTLAKLKPDIMKIDRELIQNIHEEPIKQSIFRALQDVARENNITILAEGIETKEELDFFKAHDVDLVQGYYFSKPRTYPDYQLDSQ